MFSPISITPEWYVAFSLNAALIALSQLIPLIKRLLTRSGWFHAGILGTILWGCLGWRGWLSVVVYLFLGSIVTRIGFARKEKDGLSEKRGGSRGPENLWGSAATGFLLAILIKLAIVPKIIFLIGFATSFTAKLADTFGSEIGKRWGRKTFLITSLRPVPAGTDGAISLQGTFASILGSFLMTIVMVAFFYDSLMKFGILIFLVGFLATLLESFLGAAVQHRFHWLTNEMINFCQTTIAALIAITAASFLL